MPKAGETMETDALIFTGARRTVKSVRNVARCGRWVRDHGEHLACLVRRSLRESRQDRVWVDTDPQDPFSWGVVRCSKCAKVIHTNDAPGYCRCFIKGQWVSGYAKGTLFIAKERRLRCRGRYSGAASVASSRS